MRRYGIYEQPISIKARGDRRIHFRPARGMKASIQEVCRYIHESTGVRVSVNEFVVKAIGFYLEYLLESESRQNLLVRIGRKPKTLEPAPETPDEAIENG